MEQTSDTLVQPGQDMLQITYEAAYEEAIGHNQKVNTISEALRVAENENNPALAAQHLKDLVEAERKQIAAHTRVADFMIRLANGNTSFPQNNNGSELPEKVERSFDGLIVPPDYQSKITLVDLPLHERLNKECEDKYPEEQRVVVDLSKDGGITIDGKIFVPIKYGVTVLNLLINNRGSLIPFSTILSNELIGANLANDEFRRSKFAGVINLLNKTGKAPWVLKKGQSFASIYNIADFVWIKLPEQIEPTETIQPINKVTTNETLTRSEPILTNDTSKLVPATPKVTAPPVSKPSPQVYQPPTTTTMPHHPRPTRSAQPKPVQPKVRPVITTDSKILEQNYRMSQEARLRQRRNEANGSKPAPVMSQVASPNQQPIGPRQDIVDFLIGKADRSAVSPFTRKDLQTAWTVVDAMKAEDRPANWSRNFLALQMG